jgi:Fe2+ transport system protein B
MKEISTLDSLQRHLLQRQEEKREQIEALTRQELEQLGANLRNAANRVLHITENDMQARIARMNQSLKKSLDQTRRQTETLQSTMQKMWLKPLLIGLSLFLGISLGSWGLMQFLSYQITSRAETLAQLRNDIEHEQQTLQFLRDRTWGVTLRQGKEGRFVVLPPDTKPEISWSVGGRPALRLSNE